MPKKKTLLVEKYQKGRKGGGRICVSTADKESFGQIIGAIRNAAAEHDLLVLNAQSPWGDDESAGKKRGRKAKVPAQEAA